MSVSGLPRKRVFVAYGKGRYNPPVNEIDKAIKQIIPEAMVGGPIVRNAEVQLTIQLICGFEIFGGYETWNQGYRISDGETTVVSRWLDVGLAKFADAKRLRI